MKEPRVIPGDEPRDARPPAAAGPKVVVTDDARPVVVAGPVPEAEILPPRRRRSPLRWAIGGLVLLFLAGLVTDALAWVAAAFDHGTGLGVAASAVLALGVLGPLYWLGWELRGFFRLRALDALHVRAAAELDRDQALALVEQSIRLLPAEPASEAGEAAFRAALAPHHDGRSVLNLARGELMRPVDVAAIKLIRRASLQAAAIATLSPTALTDTLLFVARAIRLLRDVAEVYGQRPGIAGLRHLVRQIAREAVTIGGADLLFQSAGEAGGSLLGRLFAGVGSGAVAGQRMARLGLLAMRVCRPIPFVESEMPKLIDLIDERPGRR